MKLTQFLELQKKQGIWMTKIKEKENEKENGLTL